MSRDRCFHEETHTVVTKVYSDLPITSQALELLDDTLAVS